MVKTTAFGAFVSLLPGRDGLVHISKLGNGKRIAKVEDVVNVGDKLQVEIAEIDARGKISLIPVQPDPPAQRCSGNGAAEAVRAGLIAPLRWRRAARTRVLERGRRRIDGDVLGAARRSAGGHRERPGRAQRVGRRVGRRRFRRRDPPPRRRLALPRAPAVQGHPPPHRATRSPTRSTLSAASSTPSPRTSTPATTRACWPSEAELAVDLVCDVVLDATIAAADVDTERQVILEEIAMRDDDPEDTLADAFAAAVFAGPPGRGPGDRLGRTPSSAMSRTQVAGYYRRRYTPDRMVVAVAGGVEHARRGALGARGLRRPTRRRSRAPAAPARAAAAGSRPLPSRGRRAGHRAGAPVHRGALRRPGTTRSVPCSACCRRRSAAG